MTCKNLLFSLPTLFVGLSLALGCDTEEYDDPSPMSVLDSDAGLDLGYAASSGEPSDDCDDEVCEFDGETYELGDTWMVECNTCTCTVDGVQCTIMACFDDEVCEFGDETYDLGETWMVECNTCTCTDDGPQCTIMYCGETDGVCEWEGTFYPQGESWPAGDGCNVCFCTGLGPKCTRMWCPGGDR
jgi:hypothetical protein